MDKLIVITGPGRGIGAATAILAAKKGFTFCANYLRNADAANLIVEQILQQGGKAFAVQADVSDEKEVRYLFDIIDSKHGNLAA